MPQGVYINRPAAFVPLVDSPLARRQFNPASNAGGYKVPVENLDQPMRHGEDQGIGRQRRPGRRQP
ncbi:MAG: hypothetical protein ABFC88_14760 [Thermoguttaceae bacterium]